MQKNNPVNPLDTKLTELERIYSIMSERIVEFGKHTDHDFSNKDLLKEYIAQQKKILSLLQNYTHQIKTNQSEVLKSNSTNIEYVALLSLQENRISELLENFLGLSKKTSTLGKTLLTQYGENTQDVEVIFKDNETINEVKKKLKESKSYISSNKSFGKKYGINISVNDNFESAIESGTYTNSIRKQHYLLTKINEAYLSIDLLDKKYQKLYTECIKKDYDFYEEILDKDFLFSKLEKELHKHHSIINISNNEVIFETDSFEVLKHTINKHISLIQLIHDLYNVFSETQIIIEEAEHEGGYINELLEKKRDFINSIPTIFPDGFIEYNSDNYKGIFGFFARFKQPFGRDNIQLSNLEKEDFLKKIESIGIDKIRKELSYIDSIRSIIKSNNRIKDYEYGNYGIIQKKFNILRDKSYREHKKNKSQDTTKLEENILGYEKTITEILDILTGFRYYPGAIAEHIVKILNQMIKESPLSSELTQEQQTDIYILFHNDYIVQKRRYKEAEKLRLEREYSSSGFFSGGGSSSSSSRNSSRSSSSSSSRSSSSSSRSSSRSRSSSGGSSW